MQKLEIKTKDRKDKSVNFRTTKERMEKFMKKLKEKGIDNQVDFFESAMDAFIEGKLF